MNPTSPWRRLVRGLIGVTREEQAAAAIRDELQHYIDQSVANHVADGLSPAEAQRAVQREVGNVTRVREEIRESFWESTVNSLITDVRYSFRMLRRTPVFTCVVVAVISLGIGAVTTIFSAANAFLLKPLPGATDPDRLVGIDRIESHGDGGASASYPYYTLLRDASRTFAGVAAWSKADFTITIGETGHNVYGSVVSANYFSVLGVRPALGRFFVANEDVTPLAHPVVVISNAFWRSALAGDSAVIGTKVRLNGTPYTIIGVAPPEFRGVFTPLVTSAWIPLMMQPAVLPKDSLGSSAAIWLRMFGRLSPSVTREMARQDLVALTSARIAEHIEPDWMKKEDGIRLIALTGLPDDAQRAMRAFTGVLLGVASLVLLIACVNVAAMLSARALARRHEMAVRVALGAGRFRLTRQLLTESVVLFNLGAIGGVGLTVVATRLLERIPLPTTEPFLLDLAPDVRVLGFALAVSLATAVLFGLAPALRSANPDTISRLRNDTRAGSGRRTVVNDVLVVGQLALSLVLLVSAGLLLRALQRGESVDPRFDVNGVATAVLRTAAWGYDEPSARRFQDQLRGRLASTAGVTSVSFAATLPLQMNTSGDRIQFDDAMDHGDVPARGTRVETGIVDADYFDVLRIPLLHGRAFSRGDDAGALPVAVVNETLARKHWPAGNAIGQTFGFHGTRTMIVGVVRDARYATLTEITPGFVYFPISQHWPDEQTLMVRTSGNAVALSAPIQDAIRSIDRGLPPAEVVTLKQATSFVLLPQRVAAIVTGALGVLGLLLATTGLYGIISYSVGRRAREIGVRMALGARAADVQRMIVAGGMRLAGLGVVLGLLLAVAASRVLVAYLYGVNPMDPATFVLTSLGFLLVASLASYLPARRAAAADPLMALRSD